jgi:hypothetical protein
MRFIGDWLKALVDGIRDPEARPLFAIFGGFLATGTVFYTLVEGWSPLDSLYFCVTTLATVGFGDLTPQTDLGKLFTILYILSGISLVVAFANAVLKDAAERAGYRPAARIEPPDAPGSTPDREG